MPCHDYILFIKSDKSQKWSAQNRGYFWRAKSEKLKKKFPNFLLSQIVQNIILINYIPIKAMLTTLVSRKNAKKNSKIFIVPNDPLGHADQ